MGGLAVAEEAVTAWMASQGIRQNRAKEGRLCPQEGEDVPHPSNVIRTQGSTSHQVERTEEVCASRVSLLPYEQTCGCGFREIRGRNKKSLKRGDVICSAMGKSSESCGWNLAPALLCTSS